MKKIRRLFQIVSRFSVLLLALASCAAPETDTEPVVNVITVQVKAGENHSDDAGLAHLSLCVTDEEGNAISGNAESADSSAKSGSAADSTVADSSRI